jgi:hypothetical protein
MFCLGQIVSFFVFRFSFHFLFYLVGSDQVVALFDGTQ